MLRISISLFALLFSFYSQAASVEHFKVASISCDDQNYVWSNLKHVAINKQDSRQWLLLDNCDYGWDCEGREIFENIALTDFRETVQGITANSHLQQNFQQNFIFNFSANNLVNLNFKSVNLENNWSVTCQGVLYKLRN